MHSAALPETRRPLHSRRGWGVLALVLAAAGLLAGPERLAAQTAAWTSVSDTPPAGVNAVAPPSVWLAPPAALPPMLTPPSAGADGSVSSQEPTKMVPVLFGIFGGIAGMFVGDWWADQECDSDCGAGRIAMLFLAGGVGAMIGWLIGGGDLPSDSPPGRWP
jgi:hypothetical protein